MITQAPRGVEDWYGERMHKRAWVEKQARELARTYNMTEIITPIFEHTVLFQRGVGETTDVVQKEMYTFEDRGGRSITLPREPCVLTWSAICTPIRRPPSSTM